MSTRGYAPLPPALWAFRVIWEGAEVPYAVWLVMDAVLDAKKTDILNATEAALLKAGDAGELKNWKSKLENTKDAALLHQKPAVKLNRTFGQLRRRNPCVFRDLATWLAQPDTRKHAADYGAYWAWIEWCKATDKLMLGQTASASFGIKGNTRQRDFTRGEDAAMLAEHLAKRIGSEAATAHAAELLDLQDRRLIQRQRSLVRKMGLSKRALTKQAAVVRAKYAPKESSPSASTKRGD